MIENFNMSQCIVPNSFTTILNIVELLLSPTPLVSKILQQTIPVFSLQMEVKIEGFLSLGSTQTIIYCIIDTKRHHHLEHIIEAFT